MRRISTLSNSNTSILHTFPAKNLLAGDHLSFQVIGAARHAPDASLFPDLDGDYSMYRGLLKGIEELDSSCFYGRPMGFQVRHTVSSENNEYKWWYILSSFCCITSKSWIMLFTLLEAHCKCSFYGKPCMVVWTCLGDSLLLMKLLPHRVAMFSFGFTETRELSTYNYFSSFLRQLGVSSASLV